MLFLVQSDKISLVQNIISEVLEAWALEPLMVSHIRMQEKFPETGGIDIYCVVAECVCRA